MNSADAAEMMALSSAAGEGGCGSAGPSSPTLQCQQNPFPPTRPERKRCRPTVSLLMITVFLTLLGTAVSPRKLHDPREGSTVSTVNLFHFYCPIDRP